MDEPIRIQLSNEVDIYTLEVDIPLGKGKSISNLKLPHMSQITAKCKRVPPRKKYQYMGHRKINGNEEIFDINFEEVCSVYCSEINGIEGIKTGKDLVDHLPLSYLQVDCIQAIAMRCLGLKGNGGEIEEKKSDQ